MLFVCIAIDLSRLVPVSSVFYYIICCNRSIVFAVCHAGVQIINKYNTIATNQRQI